MRLESEHIEELRRLWGFIVWITPSLLSAALIVLCIIVLGTDRGSYGASIHLKEQALRESESPRIIIVGGSGASGSIDSEMLASSTKRAVVNMGLYAGVGLRFALNQVREEVGADDIVLIAPEYEMLQQPGTGDGFLLLELLSQKPTAFFEVITPRGLVAMTRAFPGWLRVQTVRAYTRIHDRFVVRERTPTESLYRLTNVTDSGELETQSAGDRHLSEAELKELGAEFVRPHMDQKNLVLITEFIQEVEARGARVFAVLPAVPRVVLSDNLPAIETQYAELAEHITPLRIIGTPGSFVFETNRFLDALGHLTWRGKEERTRAILDILLNRLANSTPS